MLLQSVTLRSLIYASLSDSCLGRRIQASSATTQSSGDRKSTRLNSSHTVISYAVFCLKKKKNRHRRRAGANEADGTRPARCGGHVGSGAQHSPEGVYADPDE